MHPVQALNVAHAARARHQKSIKLFEKCRPMAESFPHGSAVRQDFKAQIDVQQRCIDVCNMLIAEQRNLLRLGFTSEKLVKKYSRSPAYWAKAKETWTLIPRSRLQPVDEVQAELDEAVATGRLIYD